MSNIPVSCRFSASAPQQPGTMNGSVGRYVSVTDIANTGIIFTSLSPEDNSMMANVDRCLFLLNNQQEDFAAVLIEIDQVQPGVDLFVGVDPLAASPVNSNSPQSSLDASGVQFSRPGVWLPLGFLPVGYCRAFWVRLHGLDSPPSNSGFRLGIRSSQSTSNR